MLLKGSQTYTTPPYAIFDSLPGRLRLLLSHSISILTLFTTTPLSRQNQGRTITGARARQLVFRSLTRRAWHDLPFSPDPLPAPFRDTVIRPRAPSCPPSCQTLACWRPSGDDPRTAHSAYDRKLTGGFRRLTANRCQPPAVVNSKFIPPSQGRRRLA